MTQKLFIGGITSSGTTATRGVLARCGFAATTGDYVAGQRDPEHPKPWYPPREPFRAWVENWCRDKPAWWLEKSPGRFLWFEGIQALWPDSSHFIMLQRDPFDTVVSNQRRWPKLYGTAGKPYDTIAADHDSLTLRLRGAAALHDSRDRLTRFQYVRYERLCAVPRDALYDVLLGLGVYVPACVRATALKVIRRPGRYPNLKITSTAPETLALCTDLAQRWGYPQREATT